MRSFFTVSTASGELRLGNVFAFPNPFDNTGTNFSFELRGSTSADVRITVTTISGRPVWSTTVRDLAPGYHQLPWDARDAEGSTLANGVYFYRINATNAAGVHVS